jgi:hypothetical protein
MEPSSPASHPLTSEDALVLEATNIRQALDAIASQQQKVEQLLRQQLQVLTETRKLIDGFTDSGGSYRAYQADPMIMVYAAILGPVLSDRLDSQASKGDDYMADMTKGSAVLARQLLRTLDEYRGSREGMDYIESEMQGSTLFPGNPPSTNSSNEPPT